MAASDERNFRTSYYGKVGFKGIEEKKSIEILLKDQPLDIGKLSQFCLRFPIPTSYRYFIWQVLLGVLPPYQEVHVFALEQRRGQYEDLERMLRVIRKVDDYTPQNILFLKMYLIEDGSLPLDDINPDCPKNACFLAVTNVVADLISDKIEAFWISVYFIKYLHKFKKNLDYLPAHVEFVLKREDAELFHHLCTYNLVEALPLRSWFATGFAGVFESDCVERIWDRLIGGSCKFLTFVAVSILISMKRTIVTLKNAEEILHVLREVHPRHSELILSSALDLWSNDGCQLVPSSTARPDSPAIADKFAS